MSISLQCDRCGKELLVPGALVFSPPFGIHKVIKLHICVDCWSDFWAIWMENDNGNQQTGLGKPEAGCTRSEEVCKRSGE